MGTSLRVKAGSSGFDSTMRFDNENAATVLRRCGRTNLEMPLALFQVNKSIVTGVFVDVIELTGQAQKIDQA